MPRFVNGETEVYLPWGSQKTTFQVSPFQDSAFVLPSLCVWYLDEVEKGKRGIFLSQPPEEPRDTRNRMPLFFMSLFLQNCSGKPGPLGVFPESPCTEPESSRQPHTLDFCHVPARGPQAPKAYSNVFPSRFQDRPLEKLVKHYLVVRI